MPLPPILYEDDTLIAFAKPSGVAVAPGRGKPTPLMAEVQARWGKQAANVHRLDAETSGVLICAKTKPALDSLSGLFQAKRVAANYLALAVVLAPERVADPTQLRRGPDGGLPAEFSIDLALAPDEARPGFSRVAKRREAEGKPSQTEVRVLESFGRFAWLECRPLTGRLHQVRVHLAAIGAPVLNDGVYGDPEARLLLSDLKRGYKGREEERPLLSRLALHAGELTLPHPVTGQALNLAAPLPPEFAIALKYLRKFGGGLQSLRKR
jgi:23S rRNA-/tRNA-specific pseudouridylate synthase